MRMFSALALTSANRRHEAVATLMRTLLAHADTPESQRFRRALTWYVEELESSPGSA